MNAPHHWAASLPVHLELPEIDPASGSGQRWRDRRPSWADPRRDRFDPRRYEVRTIDDATAKSYVEQHHYSASYVAARRRYGMFIATPDGWDLVGVAVFSIPAQARVLTNVLPDLRPYTESLELGRLVLEGAPCPRGSTSQTQRAPGNSESWFLAQCFRYLATDGVAGVVSFADPVPRIVNNQLVFPGHVGTIYQASNALLTGRSASRYLTVLPDGTSLSDRALQISCGAGAGTVAPSCSECAAGPVAWSTTSLDSLWRLSPATSMGSGDDLVMSARVSRTVRAGVRTFWLIVMMTDYECPMWTVNR